MSCIITFDKQGNKIGVEQNNELFQQILSNPQVKDFNEAIQIFKETYSDKIDIPRVRVQDSGFFSNVEQSFINLKDKTVKNIQGWIKALTDTQKNGGIKNVNQELEWIGLEEHLNEYVKENNPKAGNIPSSVVEDYIKSNQIEIVDVSKTSNSNRGKYNQLVELQTQAVEEGNYDIAEGYRVQIEQMEDEGTVDNTKYSGYQLKGASNYREVLLTMPPKKVLKSKSGFYSPQYLKEQEDLLQELKSKGYTVNKEGEVFDLEGNNIPYGENKIPDDIEEFIDSINYEAYYTDKEFYETTEEGYRSSHWSEENIIAHVRMNEKTLPDGRRVLILNEIQSDSGQAIKKDEDFILKEIENNFDNIYNKLLKSGIIKEDC